VGHQLKFRQLPGLYAIVRLAHDAQIPPWATQGDFTSITRTAEELSIVCAAENLPSEVLSQHDWICLKLEGPFPFSLTGVLLSFIEPLSKNGVPIFAVSTFETIFLSSRNLPHKLSDASWRPVMGLCPRHESKQS
jgi:hypothetical protein